MDLQFTPEDEQFREEVRDWLETQLAGDFKEARGRGGPGDEEECFELRHAWEKRLGEAGWACVAWPKAHGGRSVGLMQEVIWHEEYARAGAPGRVGHIGVELLGPTVMHFGTEDQKSRFLPPIAAGAELWCQGYSEPNAGSDLANVQCRAELDGDEWVITGQKTWTSLAHWSDWVFALCRTDPSAPKHRGISYLLVPMRQPGIEIRPIEQMTGGSEFSEVFFEEARTAKENVVGAVNGGWRVAMGTLAFERGASTLGQQLAFENELREITAVARSNGAVDDPLLRDRLSRAWMELRIMRLNALRILSRGDTQELGREAMITKLYWASWHRDLGKLAMDILGPEGEVPAGAGGSLDTLQRLFLWSRCDTIYAGSNQVQRNIIGERALGLPREPRP